MDQDMKKCLVDIPFTEIIPTQTLAPFLSSLNIKPVEENVDLDKNTFLLFRHTINDSPQKHEDIIRSFAEKFSDFNDPELDEIRFKNCSIENQTTIDIPPFEKRIFDSIESKVIKFGSEVSNAEKYVDSEEEFEDQSRNESTEISEVQSTDPTVSKTTQNHVSKAKIIQAKRPLEDFDYELPNKKLALIKETALLTECFKATVDKLETEVDSNVWTPTSNGHKILSTFWIILLLDQVFRISKLTNLNEVDLEYIQKFCSICFANISETLEEDWTEFQTKARKNEYPYVFDLMDQLFNALFACKSILVVSNNRKEHRFFVNEHIKAIIDYLYTVVEDILLPWATDINFKKSIHTKNILVSLASEVCATLKQLVTFMKGNIMDDQLLTKLEYLSIHMIFANFFVKDKLAVINSSTVDDLKLSATMVLCQIFKKYPEQRQFILEEISIRFIDIGQDKQFKIYRGVCILSVSGLILCILQTFDVSTCSVEASNCLDNYTESDTDLFASEKHKELQAKISSLYRGSKFVAEELSNILFDDFCKNPDQTHKNAIENFIEDLLEILPYPEWSSAEFLLSVFFKKFLNHAVDETNEFPVMMETYMLELSGNIGVRVFDMKQKLNVTSDESFADLNNTALQVAEYVFVQAQKNALYQSSFNFLLLKYLEQTYQVIGSYGDDGKVPQSLKPIILSFLTPLANGVMPLNLIVDSNAGLVSKKNYLEVLKHQELFQMNPNFIELVLSSLKSTKVKTRSRAIKILSQLIDSDSGLLTSTLVRDSIANLMQDKSAMVRDSVIDLVNSYMNLNPNVIQQFYKPISECIGDTSILVKRRVLKICKMMFLKSNDRGIKSYLCLCYLERLDKEEDVSTVYHIYQILMDLLFNDEIELEVLIEVNNHEQSRKILREYFEAYVLQKSRAKLNDVAQRCMDLILFNDVDVNSHLLMILSVVQADGNLLNQDQLVFLRPFLENDQADSKSVVYVLLIMKSVLEKSKALRVEFINSIESVIFKKLTKFETSEMKEAFACLRILNKLSGNTNRTANACVVCLQHLKPYIIKTKKGDKNVFGDYKLGRLISLLGNFGSFDLFESHREAFANAMVGLKKSETITSLLTKVLIFFHQHGNRPIRNLALKNLIEICASHPALFLTNTILMIIDGVFKSKSDIRAQYLVIDGFVHFLENEEIQSIKRSGRVSQSSKNAKLDLAAFHGQKTTSFVNDSISAAIVQRYSSKIFPLCFYDNGDMSIYAIRYLKLMTKLGFANPKSYIALAVALESLPNKYIRNVASDVHKELFNKYESLLDGCYLEALKEALRFRSKFGNIRKERFFLRTVYDNISYTRNSRKKFITAMGRVFPMILYDDEKNSEDAIFQRNLVLYTCVNLSTISFRALEDVYLLVDEIDRTIRKEGDELCDEIKQFKDEEYGNGKLFFLLAQTFIVMMSFRQFLCKIYSVNESLLYSFDPDRIDSELKNAPKLIQLETFTLDGSIYEEIDERQGRLRVFATFVEKIKEFEM